VVKARRWTKARTDLHDPLGPFRIAQSGPSLVLGDEPTGAVDSETSDQLAAIMRRLNRQQEITFVIVTHDMDLAAKTDRISRLKSGKVQSDETTALTELAV